MKYKLLALDLDETLLNQEHRISSRNIEAIRAVVNKGIMVTIATGRMYLSALPYARELGIDLPLITYHGALIKQAGSGQILKHSPVPFEKALEILRRGEEYNLHLNLYLDDRLFVKEENDHTRYYQRRAAIPLEIVGDLSSFLLSKGEAPTKLTIIIMDGRMDEFQQIFEEICKPQLFVVQSSSYFLEITHRDATKGQALDFLAKKEGILPEEIIAMGDSYNDIDMLQYAGLGVAVANAPPEVQNAADITTLSNIEDGVAVFLEKHILGRV
ncbi:MAG: Cof-type HAD-IIB family hydrolase [Dethiobacteria bacterium]|jgi:Cof subfamily protein (haloacid dehalogenase superfamily)